MSCLAAAAEEPPCSRGPFLGLRDTEWLGRTQVLRRGPLTWYLDGAHTTSSMQACVRWFRQALHRRERPSRWAAGGGGDPGAGAGLGQWRGEGPGGRMEGGAGWGGRGLGLRKKGVGLGDRVGTGTVGRKGSFWRKDGAGPVEKGWEVLF